MLNDVEIPVHGLTDGVTNSVTLAGSLTVPKTAHGLVLFAHGSGSSRLSPRNQAVARTLQCASLATLLFDLLTPEEEAVDQRTFALRFNIPLLADRLVGATQWAMANWRTDELPLGYFGASTGAAAALIAAAELGTRIRAVVARGGRPDLAGAALARVRTPTLLIVGGHDRHVLELNQDAEAKLAGAVRRLEVVPGATHLFEEPGALECVAELARDFFLRYLPVAAGGSARQTGPRATPEAPIHPEA